MYLSVFSHTDIVAFDYQSTNTDSDIPYIIHKSTELIYQRISDSLNKIMLLLLTYSCNVENIVGKAEKK